MCCRRTLPLRSVNQLDNISLSGSRMRTQMTSYCGFNILVPILILSTTNASSKCIWCVNVWKPLSYFEHQFLNKRFLNIGETGRWIKIWLFEYLRCLRMDLLNRSVVSEHQQETWAILFVKILAPLIEFTTHISNIYISLKNDLLLMMLFSICYEIIELCD